MHDECHSVRLTYGLLQVATGTCTGTRTVHLGIVLVDKQSFGFFFLVSVHKDHR